MISKTADVLCQSREKNIEMVWSAEQGAARGEHVVRETRGRAGTWFTRFELELKTLQSDTIIAD